MRGGAVITFAHRGARLVEPENSVPAFRRALAAGVSGLETDVWLSADGEVVCAHDPVVGRGLRRRKLAATTAAELGELGVPRLADVYEELGAAYELSVDVKEAAAAASLLALARRYDATRTPVAVLTRRGAARHAAGRDRPSSSCTPNGGGRSARRSSATRTTSRRCGIDAMNLHHTEWTAGLVSLFHRFDVKAFAWDTQETRHIRAVLRMGIDAVYCDHPDRMVATVSEWVTEQIDD